ELAAARGGEDGVVRAGGERQGVQAAVAAQGGVEVLAGAGELGRIADDDVEGGGRGLLEITEDVALDGVGGGQTVQLEVRPGPLQRSGRDVDGDDRARAAARRRQAE